MYPGDKTKIERMVLEKSSDSSPARLLVHRASATPTLSSEQAIKCSSSTDDLVTPQKIVSGKFDENCDSSVKSKRIGCEPTTNDENENEGCSSGSSSRFRVRLFSPASTPSASGILKRRRLQDSPNDCEGSPGNRHVHFAPDIEWTNDDRLERAKPSPPLKKLRLVDPLTPDTKQSESKRRSSFADKFSPRTHALITSILKHNKLDDLGFTAIRNVGPPNRIGAESNSNGSESTVARSQPIWPSLVKDKSDVTILFPALANPSLSNLALSDYFDSKNIATVGQLAQMTELQAHFLPIKPPKMSVLRSVLESYEKERKISNDDRIESDKPSGSCFNNTILSSPQRFESVENEKVENEEINKGNSINKDEIITNLREGNDVELPTVNLTYEDSANVSDENYRENCGAFEESSRILSSPSNNSDIATQTESVDFNFCVENLRKFGNKRNPTVESLSLQTLFDLFENLQSAISYVIALVKSKLIQESP